MKIAIVISQFPCSDEVFILRELRALQDLGFDLRIYSLKFPEETLHAEAKPLLPCARYSPFVLSGAVAWQNLRLLATNPLLCVRMLSRIVSETWRSPRTFIRSIAVFPVAVRRGMELKADPVDRIHAHWATHPSTAGWVMSKISGIPLSITAHAHDIYLDQSMLRFKLEEAVAVLTCTRQNLDFLKRLAPDLPEGRVRLSYHGLDLRAYSPAAGKPEVFRILSVGTLLPRKGFDTLVEACALLEADGLAYECEIVGDGPMRAKLEARAAELGVRNVRFLGKQSQEQLPGIYRRASVFVLAAVPGGGDPGAQRPGASDLLHFGIPNVIIEAMASGVAVVATRMPALVELLVEGENGIYIPERDPRALADALRALAADPVRRASLGARAVERVRRGFDIAVTSAEVAETLRA